MSYSLYNKYRPQTFSSVVGQEHVEKTLANAVATGSFSHAYLFTGPRGTGKTTTARLLAKALLCQHGPTPTPDGTCSQCLEISEGVHPDVYELDAASRTGVDNVREEIIGRVQFAPTHGKYKVYIIDEVHMLSTAAFNALLMTLEKPPPHVVFVLCTTDIQKVLPTVVSRCQRFDFHRLSALQIAGRLRYICEQEQFSFDEQALELIAQRSAGGMRDAIGALEQVAVFGGGEVSYLAAESMLGEVSNTQLAALALLIAQRDAAGCFEWVAGFIQGGSDIATLVSDFALHIRNVYVVAVAGENTQRLATVLEVDEDAIAAYRDQAAAFVAVDRLAYVLTVLGDLSSELKDTANARLALEIALTKMVRPQSSLSLEALAARLAVLESRPQGSVAAAGIAGDDARLASLGAETLPAGLTDAQTLASPEVEPAGASADFVAGAKAEAGVEQPQVPSPEILQSEYHLWNLILDRIKKERLALGANLGGSQPHLDTAAGCLTVELPPKASLSKQTLEKPENHKYVTEVVQAISKQQLTVRYVLGDAPIPPCTPDLEIDGTLLDETPDDFGAAAVHHEPQAETDASPAPVSEPTSEPTPEPTKEDLESILSTSINTQIKFEEL